MSHLGDLGPWTGEDDRSAHGHSPHLRQWTLRQRLLRWVTQTVAEHGPGPRVLELGAGHGGYSTELLGAGAQVTLVELSPTGLAEAVRRNGPNPAFRAMLDPAADLADVGEGFDAAVVLSVLHHVPDYLALLDRLLDRLAPGASLVTVQDPLWYPRCSALTRRVDRAAYLAWRVGQGDVVDGVRAALRRARGVHPSHGDGELSYYHVVRSGVDECAVEALLRQRFERVEVVGYWSNHLAAAADPARWAGLRNTFAVRATAHRPTPPLPP